MLTGRNYYLLHPEVERTRQHVVEIRHVFPRSIVNSRKHTIRQIGSNINEFPHRQL